jgi:hypothetical protein
MTHDLNASILRKEVKEEIYCLHFGNSLHPLEHTILESYKSFRVDVCTKVDF